MNTLTKVVIVLLYAVIFCVLVYYTVWGQYGKGQEVLGISENVLMRVCSGVAIIIMILSGVCLYRDAKD